MRTIAVALLLAAAPLAAQKFELGGVGGFGSIGVEGLTYRTYSAVGVEACAICAGAFSIFADYTHWQNVGKQWPFRVTNSELVSGGLRVQGGRRVRPFFDVGFAAGRDTLVYPGGQRSQNMAGGVLGGGVAIGFGKRFYVRPQYRLYVLSGPRVVTGASVGIGFRF